MSVCVRARVCATAIDLGPYIGLPAAAVVILFGPNLLCLTFINLQ